MKYAQSIVKWPFLQGSPYLEGEKYFDPLFCHNHSLAKPKINYFVPRLSEIGDLSFTTSCLVWPSFFLSTLLIGLFPQIRALGHEFVIDKAK